MPRWPPISGSGKKPVLIQKQTIGYSPARTRAGNIPSGQILSSRKSFVRQRSERESRWHTFRHSYSSLLVANGENVKVVQELMRHASSRVTLEVYSQARNAAKRQAQERGRPDDLSCAAGGCGTRNFLRGVAARRQLDQF